MHRLSDLLAAGDATSEQVALAEGLLADTENLPHLRPSRKRVGGTAELVGLTGAERDLLAGLPRGVALCWAAPATSSRTSSAKNRMPERTQRIKN